MFQLGIDQLLQSSSKLAELKSKRVALLGHPASVTSNVVHSMDALHAVIGKSLVSCFGPQHGMRGDKQYNMLETLDERDEQYDIPVFSLYGKVRRPTDEMIATFDTLVVDLQDVGCRIYTYIATMLYMMEACAKHKKKVIVLDRPNPAGRPIEGLILEPGTESFVGVAPIIMRHGLTIGELAVWFRDHFKLDLDLEIIWMKDYNPNSKTECGWPAELAWVNPSPNAPTLSMVRSFPGSVQLEGTHLSEGRGTTRPLEILGAPGLKIRTVLSQMEKLSSDWMKGCRIRPCYFEPTFYKHHGKLCEGFQVHAEGSHYDHVGFRPFRLYSLALKAIRLTHTDLDIWRQFGYEYVFDRLAIDVINGGSRLREWVDDSHATVADLEKVLVRDEKTWTEASRGYLHYK